MSALFFQPEKSSAKKEAATVTERTHWYKSSAKKEKAATAKEKTHRYTSKIRYITRFSTYRYSITRTRACTHVWTALAAAFLLQRFLQVL